METNSQRVLIGRRHFLAASLISAFTPSLTEQSVHGNEAERPEAQGFRPVFNGRNLEGWHRNRPRSAHGTGGQWLVEDGVLTGEQDPPGSGNGGLLLTDEKYEDFELLIDMNPDWGPDSGVFFRCTDNGAGFQMYVDYHEGGNVGHLRGEMPGSFALKPFQIVAKQNAQNRLVDFLTQPDPRAENWPEGVYEDSCSFQQWRKAWRIGQWNTARIRCVGRYPQITTWINGVKICHFDGETCTHPGYDKERVFGILGRSGSIGLQVHGGKGWPKGPKCRWRRIQIRQR